MTRSDVLGLIDLRAHKQTCKHEGQRGRTAAAAAAAQLYNSFSFLLIRLFSTNRSKTKERLKNSDVILAQTRTFIAILSVNVSVVKVVWFSVS